MKRLKPYIAYIFLAFSIAVAIATTLYITRQSPHYSKSDTFSACLRYRATQDTTLKNECFTALGATNTEMICDSASRYAVCHLEEK